MRELQEMDSALSLSWTPKKTQSSVDLDLVKKITLICRKHFVGGKGRTTDHPDPIPAAACPERTA